jgi:hypothetical protein
MEGKRMASRKRRGARSNARQRWIVIGVVALVVFGVSAFFIARAMQDEDDVQKFTDMGNAHLPSEPTSYIWNSRPPTSGPHSDPLAEWGIHEESVPEWNQVHNLEDGGVIIHYNCPDGCPDIVAELEAIVREKGEDQLILHPYTNMDSRIALTAWTRMLTMEDVDRGKIEDFIDEYRGIDHHR